MVQTLLILKKNCDVNTYTCITKKIKYDAFWSRYVHEKQIEYLQSISLRGITAKTCTYSRVPVHAFNYRSVT